MRKMLVGLAVVAMLGLVAPRPAAADVSFAIGLPGFGFIFGVPVPPPVVYAPPVVYSPPVVYGPPAYYRPTVYYGPSVVYAPRYAHDHGRHRGWYKHGYRRDYDD